jgi:ribosomal protein S18 acetylase RimI-like enzyme
MSLRIEPAAPDRAPAIGLIAEADEDSRARYPATSVHGFDAAAVLPGGFLIAWLGEQAVGCGAVTLLEPGVGELKRFYVRPEWRRRGIARRLLDELEAVARSQGCALLRLETGTRQPAAIALYLAAGYRPIPRYGEYAEDPFSRCYEKRLDGAELP